MPCHSWVKIKILLIKLSMNRYLQARDVCTSLGVKLIEEICKTNLKLLLYQGKHHHHLVLCPMKGGLWNTTSTSVRFGVVNENLKVDARCVE